MEYYKNYDVENFRYDSIGWISALAPPPAGGGEGGGKDADYSMAIIAATLVVIVIIILLLLFIFMRKKRVKKTIIDFTQGSPAQQTKPADIQQMFLTPFEQQFQRPPTGGAGVPPPIMHSQSPAQYQPTPTQPGQQPTTGASIGQQKSLQPPSFSKPQLPPKKQ